MIAARDIYFTYPDGVDALTAVSIAVEPGTITGIIGPNGSGKTTLIKVLAGLLEPSRGSVELDGQPLSDRSIAERSKVIAYVSQDTLIPFSYTALEIVLMGRAPYLKPLAFEGKRDYAIAHRAMMQTEVEQYAGRPIQELSGGERQRVILARALAQTPRVMLLDEPTASLDIKHQIDLYRLLTQRRDDERLTVLAAIHDLNIAAHFCDRIVVLGKGRIAAAGTPRSVLTREMLRDVFAADVWVGERGPDGLPYVLPSIPH